mmetsp:Transcript_17796/g.27519  ORF Transcript_17796/g.27519 Transcript_17796/m.27519 type:complete len:95 (+) Transcript_17796:701-985(+)
MGTPPKDDHAIGDGDGDTDSAGNKVAIITRLAAKLNVMCTPELLDMSDDTKKVADILIGKALDNGTSVDKIDAVMEEEAQIEGSETTNGLFKKK